jgi:membrane protease YdiL (CAAX protease family)
VVELGVLAAATGVFLCLWPDRPPGVDPALAVAGLGLAALAGRRARRPGSRPTDASPLTRLGRASVRMAWFTGPGLLLFAASGAGAGREILPARFFVLMLVFVPWALVQQTLFQVYLLGRLGALLPAASPLVLAGLNGLLFGAVHIPDWDVVLLTAPAGAAWSLAYLCDRSLPPLALSHALLGSAYFGWVRGSDALRF